MRWVSFTGNGFASFLLGVRTRRVSWYAPITRLRNFYVAPYFQDNIKLTPHFTLNWGLRWDLAFPFSNDNQANRLVFFNPLVPNPRPIDPVTGQPRLGAHGDPGERVRWLCGLGSSRHAMETLQPSSGIRVSIE